MTPMPCHALVYQAACAWQQAHCPAYVVALTAVRGSAPREVGTRMVVSAHDAVGTVGGGHLEWELMAEARALLRAGAPAVHVRRFSLGAALGQCCGGAVEVRYERLDEAVLARWPTERPQFALQLHGAGHVGQAIVRLLAPLPVQVHWVDSREAIGGADPMAIGANAASIVKTVSEAPEHEVGDMAVGSYYLVMTHDHDLDGRIVEAILRRGDFAYCGMIGSATKRRRFEQRLQARGLPAERLARLVCPIGLPGITGKAPEIIAIAVVAQVLQHVQGTAAPAVVPVTAGAH